MYQVFDSELLGLTPLHPVDDDYTSQRIRDPGEGLDDVLGLLGLEFSSLAGGDQMGGRMDDPGGDGEGGWGCWGNTGDGAGKQRTAFGGGQLMETDSDECDYVDYNCFSSGLTSPALDSEFFFRRIQPPWQDGPAYHLPWEFTPISSAEFPAGFSGRQSHSPYFHRENDLRLADCSFPGAQFESSDDASLQEEFDSEAELKVKEIARYLASFEVQSYPDQSTVSHSSSNGNSSFPNETSMTEPNGDQVKYTSMAKSSGSMKVSYSGFDDTCSGFESTLVNPNEVFPDRIDRSDHQYASRPFQKRQGPSTSTTTTTTRHFQRTSPTTLSKAGGVSVLEALLRSTEPIDPNKGSGAAIGFDDPEDLVSRCCDEVDAKIKGSEMVIKKLLTGRIKDEAALNLISTVEERDDVELAGNSSSKFFRGGSMDNDVSTPLVGVTFRGIARKPSTDVASG